MIKDIGIRCSDINSPYCPCLLAETNHCVFCNHLKGGTACDCNWSGICILYEKHWQTSNYNKKNGETQPLIRSEIETDFVIKEKINDKTYIIDFSVSLDLANQLQSIGSFVFLRRANDPQFLHFPVGIMKVTGTTIRVAIEAIGPKSVRLFQDNDFRIIVRGPYYNGVLGQPWIDNITNGRILLVAGGIGQAPALPIIEKLVSNKNEIETILAPGQVQKIFITEELLNLGIQVHTVPSMRRDGLTLLAELFELKPDLVVSAGPDNQHYAVISTMNETGVNLPMAATNNATMCCGEGVCGSCQQKMNNGKIIRMCKVQTEFSNIAQD